MNEVMPFITVFSHFLGNYDTEVYEGEYAIILYTVLAMFLLILQLNLLIAIMGDSYERVKEGEALEAIREKALLVLEYERMLPKKYKKFHRYLILCERDDIPRERPDHHMAEGISGRVKMQLGVLAGDIRTIQQSIDGFRSQLQPSKSLETKIETLEKKMEVLASSQGEMKAMLERVLSGSQPSHTIPASPDEAVDDGGR